MNCEDARGLMLAGERTPQLESHLSSCPSCKAVLPEVSKLAEVLALPTLWEEPDALLAERVTRQVEADTFQPSAKRRGSVRRFITGSAAAVAAVLLATVAVVRINAPDWQTTLVATELAPGATAVVSGWNTATGTRLEIDVSGVPEVGPDSYYEIWMTAPDRRHVSAGTFRGPGHVYAWSGVTRAEFPRIWITLEPTDGDESLSGETVLDTVTG